MMQWELAPDAGIIKRLRRVASSLARRVRVAPMELLVTLFLGSLAQAMARGKMPLPQGLLAIGFLLWVEVLSIVLGRYPVNPFGNMTPQRSIHLASNVRKVRGALDGNDIDEGK